LQLTKRANHIVNKKLFVLIFLILCSCKREHQIDSKNIPELLRHQNLGLAYLEENQLQEARKEFETAIGLAPAEAAGYANLAVTLLREGNFPDAEKQAKVALQKSDDPDVGLILAEIYDRSGRQQLAIAEVERTVQKNPGHVRSQFKLGQLYSRTDQWQKAEPHLKRALERDPSNLAVRLLHVEALARTNNAQTAIEELSEARRELPELTADTSLYIERALEALRANKSEEAVPDVIGVHNLMKPTSLYQASIIDMVGPGGSAIGLPILHFSRAILNALKQPETRLGATRFADATASTGLQSVSGASSVSVGDFNGDGKPDICVAGAGILLKNLGAKFSDATSGSGIEAAQSSSAEFADFDNDGKLDLYVVAPARHSLYRNSGGGKFVDVTQKAGIAESGDARAVFVDLDNEGDLDLLVVNKNGNKAYRNNGDGTFTEFSRQLGLSGSNGESAAFGDFDEDGDTDVLIAGRADTALFSSLRQGKFEKVSAGLPSNGGGLAAADQNNDGLLDVFLNGNLYLNRGKSTFAQQTGRLSSAPSAISAVKFLDFDNDGFRDLAVLSAGKLLLFWNDGKGNYQDVSRLLPALPARLVEVLDYDSDGDEDLLTIDPANRLHLFRNDGGNANYWLNVRPVGLGPDSGKNNRNSIGAKVEVKAGAQYQMAVVTQPVVHFGLGDHTQADVVRVTWTNGVAQNHIQPGSNQTITEKQVLKGSCAFLYAWNGKKFEFVTDVLWKSALGMPLGIMTGEMQYGFADSTKEYLKIPGDRLKARNGNYDLRITEELWEVAYLDESKLIAVDHPDTVDIYVDETFVVPPYPPLKIYTVSEKLFPVSVVDENGRDVLPFIKQKDDVYLANFSPGKYQGIADVHDLVLDFGKQRPGTDIVLFLNGWLFPTDASINVAVSQGHAESVVHPYLQVPDARGNWQTVIPNIGFPQGKDKTMIIDLTGKFVAENYKVRIRTNMQIFWDEIFYAQNEPASPVKLTTLLPAAADLHYRGFSRVYRKGQDGPFWFDYSKVSTMQKWRDLTGNYTRYGDVTSLLQQPDDEAVYINSGDEIRLRFDASRAPKLKPRWVRDFLLYSDGWMKDGDLSTAQGQTIDPLPFHGMKLYPYTGKQSYPDDARHRLFLQKYVTRKVTDERFQKLQ
jgi:tetratricopeptide (TPR) repeat protein